MTDKVQKIREEVEKLKSNLMYGACSSQVAMETLCKEEAYNEVLAILDTMQEGTISEVWHDANEEQPEEYRTVVVWNPTTMNGEVLTRCTKVYKGRIWAYASDLLKLSNVQRTVKNRKEPVSEELEEAVNAYIGYAPEVDECSSVYGKRQAFKAGAQWKELQMINGAVETIIDSNPNDYGEFIPIIHVKVGSSYKDGEKVRIIIIKEE